MRAYQLNMDPESSEKEFVFIVAWKDWNKLSEKRTNFNKFV